MLLHLKRDVSQENSRFLVYDIKGDHRYTVYGKNLNKFERMYICDDEKTLVKIVEISSPFDVLKSYRVIQGDESFRIIITNTRNMLSINFLGLSFKIKGDILNRRYEIIDIDGTLQAYVSDNFSKKYTDIDVRNEQRELFCLSIAICINTINISREFKMQNA